MATLGTAYVQILPSAEGISGKMTEALGGEADVAGKNTGSRIASMAKKYITAAAIGATIKKSVEEGAKLEQSLGGVETLYKKHADIVIQNANNAYKTAGLSANEYMEQSTKFAASLLQSLDGDTKKAAQAADQAIIDMSDNANKFGTNIEDIQNAYQGFAKQNYTMLDNLKLGYGGTKTEMERLLADAEKISGQEYDISNLDDVYEAIHVIQQDMGVTGTTAEEASKTLSGSFASMKAAATNFLGSLALGKDIGPSLKGLVSSASTFLFDNLIPALLNIAKSIPGVLFGGLSGAIPQLLSKLPGLIKQVFSAATNIISGLADGLLKAITSFADNPEAANGGMKIVANIAGAIIKGAPKLLAAMLKLVTVIPRAVGTLITALFSKIKAAVGAKITEIVGTAKARFAGIGAALTSPITAARNAIKRVLNKIKNFFPLKIGRIFSGMKLPHFKVHGGKAPFGLMGKGKKPSINVDWYKKAENDPYMFSNATLFGAGEAGDEILYGRQRLLQDIAQASGGSIDYNALGLAVAQALTQIQLTSVLEVDGKTMARGTARAMQTELNRLQSRDGRKLGYV